MKEMNAFHDRWKNWFEWGIQHVSPHDFNEMSLRLLWEWFDRLSMMNDNLVFFAKPPRKVERKERKVQSLKKKMRTGQLLCPVSWLPVRTAQSQRFYVYKPARWNANWFYSSRTASVPFLEKERTLRTENGGWFETFNTLPVSGWGIFTFLWWYKRKNANKLMKVSTAWLRLWSRY